MEIYGCRTCGGRLATILDLGEIYPSAFVTNEVIHKEPLTLARCDVCGLVQLKHNTDPDSMYRNYWYKSSLNKSMLESLEDVVKSTLRRYPDSDKKSLRVLDIGANDGSMLSMFPDNYYTVGFDPALNLADEARGRCDLFVNDYFSPEMIPGMKFDIITAIAMFYDLNNPRAFLEDVKEIIADDGIFVLQMTDLASMVEANAFDNICHEHLCYYSLADLLRLLGAAGFSIFDVGYNDVNGGSIRVYATPFGNNREIAESLGSAMVAESNFITSNAIAHFSMRVMDIGLTIMRFVAQLMADRKTLYALGASTKGNTLLQYFNLDNRFIRAIGEVNKDKFGKMTVGTNIPIIPEKSVLDQSPNCIMILPWHFKKFFIEALWDYMEYGQVLFPLPEPQVLQLVDGRLRATYLRTGEQKWTT